MYLNLMMAIRQIDKIIEVATVNKLSNIKTLRWVILPGIIPEWITGLRSGLL